jgi:tetratricopeptide (TPR) repeat protein
MQHRFKALAVAGLVAAVATGGAGRPDADLLPAAERGRFHREVSTRDRVAQDHFDQGLILTFGFDHEEAIRAYERATQADPNLAMAWWGIGFAHGPNINIPMADSAQAQAAFEATRKAAALAGGASPVEQALIGALEKRYAWPAPQDRAALDRAYADAMRDVHERFPDDPDVAILFADALMNLIPWDYWSRTGEPRAETPEIVSTIEGVLAKHPEHPGAIHAYIHAVEASTDPGRALAAADRLRRLVPASGHLVHMPSHIDIRLGHYKQAIQANLAGIEADQKRVQRAGPGIFYSLYRAHNYHYVVYAGMFDGQRELSLRHARELQEQVPLDFILKMVDFLDGFYAVPYHAMVRFGMWDEILAEPAPPEGLKVTPALWHYSRGVALSALGRTDEATKELAAFEAAYSRVPDTAMIGNNPAKVVLDIARPMLTGELEYRKGNHDVAFAALREAVARDDSLRYDEPWGWMQPVRHALGALLLEQGRLDEAEAVYRADLERHPDNGWALHGLAECLRRAGRSQDAKQVDARFASAWTRADTKIKASCFCRRGAAAAPD